MKCKSCDTEVPPVFARALIDNKCPACGKEIMSGKDFRELVQLKNMLGNIGLSEKDIIMVAAALANKFDLVPKGSKPVMPEKPAEPDFSGLSEEERMREMALLAAKKELEAAEEKEIVKSWGLDKVTLTAAVEAKANMNSKKMVDNEYTSLFDSGIDPDVENYMANPLLPAPASDNTKDFDRMERLARAAAKRESDDGFRVRRN